MLGLTWLAYVSFGITAGSLPPLVGAITEDLGISSTQMGLVLGAWQLIYIGTASPLGAAVDRFGVRRSVGAGLLVIWLSLVLRAAAVDFFTLFGAVALFGLGGPIISTGAPKVVSQWFRGNERGLAAGIYNTGPLTGVAFALATAASFVEPVTGTWRGIAWVYGSIVLVVLVAWWLFARDAPSASPDRLRDAGERSTTRALLRLRNVRIVLALALVTFLMSHGLQNWLPTLLSDGGMTAAQAGAWVAGATMVGALGLFAIPSLARQGYRRYVMSGLLVSSAASGYGLVLLAGPSQVGALMLFAVARSPMVPIVMLILMETPGVGVRRMGAAAGLFYAIAEVGGFSGPFLLGVVRDVTGELGVGILTLSSLVGAMVVLMPLVREGREPAVVEPAPTGPNEAPPVPLSPS